MIWRALYLPSSRSSSLGCLLTACITLGILNISLISTLLQEIWRILMNVFAVWFLGILLHTYFCQGRLCLCQHIYLVAGEPMFTRQHYMPAFAFRLLKSGKVGGQMGKTKTIPSKKTQTLQHLFFKMNFTYITYILFFSFNKLLCTEQSEQCAAKLWKEKGAKHSKLCAYAASFLLQIKNFGTLPRTKHWTGVQCQFLT